MLKRLYANNYRCLVNFDINFEKLTLLAGPNGGGKSTLFDLLFGIRRLIVDNARVNDAFPPEDLTAWVNKNEQSFELDIQGENGLFCRVESWRSSQMVLSPAPPHQTGRSVFPSTAFQSSSSRGFRFHLAFWHSFHRSSRNVWSL